MGSTLVARRVLEEVKLVIVLRIEPFASFDDPGDDLRPVGVKVFLLYLFSHSLSDVFLGGRVVEDGRAVLSPTVEPLPVEGCRVVCTVEEFNELSISHGVWVEFNPHGLSVVRGTRTNFLVFRIVGVSSGVSDSSRKDPLVFGGGKVFQEYMLDSPEAPCCKCSDLVRGFCFGRHGIKCAVERLRAKDAF